MNKLSQDTHRLLSPNGTIKNLEVPKRIGQYKGFTILSSFSGREGDTPKLFIRGKHTYEANLNTENPLGTISSIEYAIRNLDRFAEDKKSEYVRKEKMLADYQEQRGTPFEHEERLRELFTKQQDMNRQLDLDKGDTQIVADTQEADIVADTVPRGAPVEAQPQSAIDEVSGDPNERVIYDRHADAIRRLQ